MKSEDVHEIIECLSKGRTIYPYHKDCYAVQLLEYAVGKQKPLLCKNTVLRVRKAVLE